MVNAKTYAQHLAEILQYDSSVSSGNINSSSIILAVLPRKPRYPSDLWPEHNSSSTFSFCFQYDLSIAVCTAKATIPCTAGGPSNRQYRKSTIQVVHALRGLGCLSDKFPNPHGLFLVGVCVKGYAMLLFTTAWRHAVCFTMQELIQGLKSLHSKKAAGPDKVRKENFKRAVVLNGII